MILTPVSVPGGTGVDHQQTDTFAATAAQTAFSLSKTPVDPSDVKMKVNGIDYENGTDFTVSGTSVTWTDPFVLSAGDSVQFAYNF